MSGCDDNIVEQKLSKILRTVSIQEESLSEADSRGDMNVVSSCVESGLDITTKNNPGNSVQGLSKISPAFTTQEKTLSEAGSRRDVNVVSSCVERRLDIDTKTKPGNSDIILSCYHGNIDEVKYLLENGASVNYLGNSSKFGLTPLHASVLGGHTGIVNILLKQNDIDINAKDRARNTAVHLACQRERVAIVKTLLQHRADINIRNCLGRTPLFAAVSRNSIDIVQMLMEAKADINITDMKGKSLLHLAMDSDSITFLVDKGVKINLRDKRGHTALTTAVILTHEEKIKTLLELGADPDIPDSKHKYPIHHAIDIGEPDIVDLLLSIDLCLDARDESGLTPLQYAAIDSRIDLAKQLVNKGANINSQNEVGYTPLYHVCYNLLTEGGELLKEFLELGCDVNLPDNAGITPLMHACLMTPLEPLEILIEAGADIHKTDTRGWSVLFHAIEKHDKFELLVSKGAHIDHTDKENFSALHHCSISDNAESAELLLQEFKKQEKNGIECMDNNGSTPLHLAAAYGSTGVMEVLLGYGSVVNVKDIHGNTPLHFAAFTDEADTFKQLLEAGADASSKDVNGDTPLDIAAKIRCYPILEFESKSANSIIQNTDNYQNRFLAHGHNLNEWYKFTMFTSYMCDCKRYITDVELAELLKENKKQTCKNKSKKAITSVFGLGKIVFQDEAILIKETITALVQKLSSKLAELDPRFSNTVVFTGSTTEDTKVGFPDEFDVMFVLDRLGELCCEPSGEDRKNSLFVPLKIQQETQSTGFEEFVINGCVSRKKVFHVFSNLLKSISTSITLPNYLIRKLSVAYDTEPIYEGVTCIHHYTWRGAEYKFMDINVDMVPAIHFKGWPSFVCPSAPIGEHIKKNGFHLVAKEFEAAGAMYETQTDTLWRLSFTMAEQTIMRGFSEEIKDEYRIAKIIRDREICPGVCFTNSWREDILDTSFILPSYFLKIALFNLMCEHRVINDPFSEGNLSETINFSPVLRPTNEQTWQDRKLTAATLYDYLREAFATQNLPYFFSSDHNLLGEHSIEYKTVAVDICKMLTEIASFYT